MLNLKTARPGVTLELEAAKSFEERCISRTDAHAVGTSIDILEVVRGDIPGQGTTLWKENLGHDEIVNYIGNVRNKDTKPLLTVFFLKSRNPTTFKIGDYVIHVNPKTMIKLQDAYDISPTFVYHASCKPYTLVQQHFFTKHREAVPTQIEGAYYIDTFIYGMFPMVHFTYDTPTRSAVYFVAHGSTDMIQQLKDLSFLQLSTPFIIDLVVTENVWTERISFDYYDVTNKIVNIESDLKELPMIDDSRIREMHSLAQHIAISTSRRDEFRTHILLLLSFVEVLNQSNAIPKKTLQYLTETLQAKERDAKCILNWFQSYQKRLEIQINLAFNLRFQRDSETNVKIAKDTAKIAQDAQRDSASMITCSECRIAAVTMFFLPGTFICAVFSMVFFDAGVDVETGKNTFFVSPKLWYFFAITVPLTILVFVVWVGWTRQRRRAKDMILKDIEKSVTSLESHIKLD
ncbi:hypothetical protein BDQ17DRAFT_1434795 [Cyathus striatus]|nr:hypothetical protein BDQ17DRAFT_1434795 [Cyathus striatus]